jgi:SecD/SecF fusion protein
MLLYYRLPGLLADIALVIYALLTFAAFKLLNVTMTLPGLAGFILSIGMAVDANILIFERLKEELRSGKTLRAAIDAGFSRAFTAIFDSNMCTAITSFILMWYGTGPVKSFALTLVIGVAISMFTAITVTRTFLHLLVSIPATQKPWLFGLGTSWFARTSRQLNIVGRRNLYFVLSGALIAVGLFFYFTSGLKPGIEFQSGTSIQATFKQPVTVTEVSRMVSALDVKNSVQISNGRTAFIKTSLDPEKDEEKINQVEQMLAQRAEPGKMQVSSIGPVISSELTRNAILAVIFASVAIVLYLSFRFAIGGFLNGLKYGVSAVIALIHDVLIIVGLFAATGYFLGWEIDTLFVTALLTIIGFSVHDTIVVFDRIRENLRHRIKGEDYEGLANRSILQTISRSINTSLTVVLTLVALTAFGGPIIRHFYIALLVGIISGTYSSIFNATPLLVVWEGITGRSRAAAGRRRLAEDKPLVSVDRARELKPLMEATGMAPNNGEADDVQEPSTTVRQTRVKVKPKKKKRRY